jgi:molybdopterin/thiamine biosynthesis adenylyltransferase
MNTFTDLPNDDFPMDRIIPAQPREMIQVPPLPAGHESEADAFARHKDIPGHHQEVLEKARILLIGGGGLNGWAGVGLARSGAGFLIFCDHDLADRTNLPRQFFFADDLGQPKAFRLVRNLSSHMIAGGEITGIALPFQVAIQQFDLEADLFVVGVDNNACRLAAAHEARARRIPAVFTMLSTDGKRCQCFLQGPLPEDPCLWCALPNLDPDRAAPCAAAIVSSCFLASAFTVFFAHRALMGWPTGVDAFNWREADLLGNSPDQVGRITRRPNCPVCGRLE